MTLYRPATVIGQPYQYEYQPVASISIIPPSQSAWYTVLNTTTNVLVLSMRFLQQNDEAAAKSLALRITVDGEVLTSSFTSVPNATVYFGLVNAQGQAVLSATAYNANLYVALPAKSAKVEIQFADTPGTNQKLWGYVYYAKLKATTI